MFGVTRETARILTFPRTREDGQSQEITVQRYFLEKYKRNLLYVSKFSFILFSGFVQNLKVLGNP